MSQKTNAVQSYRTGLVKTQETFINMLQQTGSDMALQYDTYQISCARNMMSKMVELLWKEGLQITDVNQNNITDILQTVAMLRLNPAASPREVYVILRNVNITKRIDGNKTDKWEKVFEMGVEGDGNDKLLREYGVGVKRVHNPWVVREGDGFTYPSFAGLEIKPPSWTPNGYTNEILRIVYPIEMEDGTVEYHISERAGVVVNLQAHISNNLMKNKNIGDKKKAEILDRIAGMTLEEIYQDKEAMELASPAWRSAHSREAMILRKMRNNATKKIPKDFRNSFVEREYERTFDDYDQYESHPKVDPEKVVDMEMETVANKEALDIEIIDETQADEEDINSKVEELEEVEPVKNEKPQAKPAQDNPY